MVVGTVCGYFVKGKKASPAEYPVERHSRYVPYNELETALREVNRSCPQRIDQITILQSAELDWEKRKFQYNYILSPEDEFNVHVFKAVQKEFSGSLIERMKSDPDALIFLSILVKNNFGLRFRYVIKPSNEIVQYEVFSWEIRQILEDK